MVFSPFRTLLLVLAFGVHVSAVRYTLAQSADPSAETLPRDRDTAPNPLFARDNLVAWCIVPFDDRNRTPQQRCDMLRGLGLRKYAYDYRGEHIPTFDEEMKAIKANGIELIGWWFPTVLNDEARLILDVLRRHQIKTQLWVTGGGEPTQSEAEQRARVVAEAARIRPIALAAAEIGCSVGLYNHGGWFGEPENQIAIIEELKLPNVGIVYNLHHGHDHVDRFAALLEVMKPHLYALNLNGMDRHGDRAGRKILPLGEGELDLALLSTIAASGYRGPIGILNHTQENAEQRLRQNLQGLDDLVRRLSDTPQDDKPQSAPTDQDTSQFSAHRVSEILVQAQQHGDSARGVVVFASAKFACLNCHRIGQQGGRVGPDLTGLATRRSPAEIVESVYWPQRTIPSEYQTLAILTVDGEVLRGYEMRRDDAVIAIRDPATDEVHELDLDDVLEERMVGSLMPDGLTAAMSAQQQADLVRFLLVLGREEELPSDQLETTLRHVTAHLNGPATFDFDRAPLRPQDWPSWQQHINRDRIYDFYAKQAEHFRTRPEVTLLAEFPGLDGEEYGHWGNQSDENWADDRWNQTELGSMQAGVFRGAGLTVPRAVCVQLDQKAKWATCFNPQTLRYEAVWTGGFVKFSPIRSGLMHGLLLDGTPLSSERMADRTAAVPDAASAVYEGFYRHGDRVGFVYRVAGVRYLDVPEFVDGEFQRIVAPLDEHPYRSMVHGGPQQWPEMIQTAIQQGESDGAYCIDTIQLPVENPWKSLFYLGDVAFAADGSGYVCTIQGDVWRVTGLDYPSPVATWKRFASGLHHALGMVIDNDGIFILGRDQITRLHDLNQDGEADFYECFSNAYETSPAGHDYICGLQRDSEGNFYTASGNQGLVRISPDGRTAKVIATGFRNPDGLGWLPDGTLTVPNSEGDWVPASMICAVKARGMTASSEAAQAPVPHFGYPGPRENQPPNLPLVYLPRALDNSSGGQAFIDSDRWGPVQGRIVHFSYGAAAHFLVLQDEVNGTPQGAVVPLPGEFRSGIHRGRFRPQDGQLYVAGAAGWGNYALEDGCLQRVRYTGRKAQLPIGFHVYSNGVRVDFAEQLHAETASETVNQFAQCWNYRYGPGYGSPEFSTLHPGTRGHDRLEIRSAHVLSSGKSLFLELPELQPVNQLHLRLKTAPGEACDLFVTVHAMDAPFEDFPGFRLISKTIQPHPILADVALATRSIPNPWQTPLAGAREIRIQCTSQLTFDPPRFQVQSGEPIRLTVVNPDVVPHNWVLIEPGTLERIGEQSNRFIADPDAPLRHYVPENDDVLVFTDIVPSRAEFSIYFRAPERPGRYPYLCTFPGHWSVMNGELIVAP